MTRDGWLVLAIALLVIAVLAALVLWDMRRTPVAPDPAPRPQYSEVTGRLVDRLAADVAGGHDVHLAAQELLALGGAAGLPPRQVMYGLRLVVVHTDVIGRIRGGDLSRSAATVILAENGFGPYPHVSEAGLLHQLDLELRAARRALATRRFVGRTDELL